MADNLKQVLTTYEGWHLRQPLAKNIQETYRFHVRQYCDYFATRSATVDNPLHDPTASDYAVRDYKHYLKTEWMAKPASVNLTLAAIDHFYQFLGLDWMRVQREDLPRKSPHALKPEEQKAFLRAVERGSSLHDQALTRQLFYTELRLSECAFLNVDDISISARKGMVIVWSGKGDKYREVPLNAEIRKTLQDWIKERAKRFPTLSNRALFLNLKGRRLSTVPSI